MAIQAGADDTSRADWARAEHNSASLHSAGLQAVDSKQRDVGMVEGTTLGRGSRAATVRQLVANGSSIAQRTPFEGPVRRGSGRPNSDIEQSTLRPVRNALPWLVGDMASDMRSRLRSLAGDR
jgi:hypothetical protein